MATTKPPEPTDKASRDERRIFLQSLYDRLWKALEDERTQPRDLSPLTLRLKEIQAELAALDQADEPDVAEVEDGDFDPSTV